MEKIRNGNKRKISDSPDLPDVGVAINQFLQWTSIGRVEKLQIDGYTQEVPIFLKTKAVKMPLKPQELYIRPEGQRHWKWFNIFTIPNFIAKIDDILLFGEGRYRVMEVEAYDEYGYRRYGVIEDYNNSPEVLPGETT